VQRSKADGMAASSSERHRKQKHKEETYSKTEPSSLEERSGS